MTKSNKNPIVGTMDALSVAVAVFEKFGWTVQRYENGLRGNKDEVLDHFVGTEKIKVTKAHIQRAEDIKNGLNQRLMMNVLAQKKTSNFLAEVVQILQEETVRSHKFGMLVWAPKLFQDLSNSDQLLEDVCTICRNSKYQGTIGKSIEIQFHVLSSFYNRNYDRYAYAGHDGNGNLFGFWHNTKLDQLSIIKGRIKNHQPSKQFANLPLTALNYVKVKNVE
jgi:hypothetical protein